MDMVLQEHLMENLLVSCALVVGVLDQVVIYKSSSDI